MLPTTTQTLKDNKNKKHETHRHTNKVLSESYGIQLKVHVMQRCTRKNKFSVINEEDPPNLTEYNLLGTQKGPKKIQLWKYPKGKNMLKNKASKMGRRRRRRRFK